MWDAADRRPPRLDLAACPRLRRALQLSATALRRVASAGAGAALGALLAVLVARELLADGA